MKRYYKNNKLVNKPKQLLHKGKSYLNPKDEVLKEAGYTVEEFEPNIPIGEKYLKLYEKFKDNEHVQKVSPFIEAIKDKNKNKEAQIKKIFGDKNIVPFKSIFEKLKTNKK